MIDPFEVHPDCIPLEKKSNNVLTLQEVRDIIDKQCRKVMSAPDMVWGFTRDDVLEHFEELLEELENTCSKQN